MKNDYVRYEICIRYTRHPYTLNDKGEKIQLFDKTESATWFDTIYPDGRQVLSEGISKDRAKKNFGAAQMSHIKIDQVRVKKQTYNNVKETWV
jgi:hypothetical protein